MPVLFSSFDIGVSDGSCQKKLGTPCCRFSHQAKPGLTFISSQYSGEVRRKDHNTFVYSSRNYQDQHSSPKYSGGEVLRKAITHTHSFWHRGTRKEHQPRPPHVSLAHSSPPLHTHTQASFFKIEPVKW